jgi:two-component system, chemotaxis family, CheB/CheR fusion protein
VGIHTKQTPQHVLEGMQTETIPPEGEARLRVLLALPAAVYATDRQGRITLFNEAAVALWGRRPDVGKDLWCGSWRIYRPDGTHLPHDQCPMAIALREGRSVRGEEIVVEQPNGKRVCVLPYPEPLRDPFGEMVGAVNMLVDITDRQQAEEARARLAAIVESSDDAIVSKTLDGIITSWNKGAERIFGYTAEEIIGRPITTLTTPESSDDPMHILERIRKGERVEHYETRRRTKDGRVISVSLTVSPLRDAAGRIVGASKIARDVTEQKRLQEELRERTRQLTEAERRKDVFLAMLAHELRNPLAPLRNAACLLQEFGSDPRLRGATEIVQRQVQQMTRLVDDLLDIARIAQGKIQIHKEPVELAAVVARAVETSRPLIDARKHELTVSLPSGPVWLEADPARLAQVLVNLLNNAAKYTEEGGRIWLTAEREKGDAVLRVRDTGVGIPPEVLPNIFDLYHQEERSLERSQGGLGIGLSLVRGLVEMHGGSIAAASPGVGQGSEFTVRVPALAEAPRGPEGNGKQVPAANGNTRTPFQRLLVVDDNRDSAESLALLLQVQGYEVQTAHDGLAALERARVFRPDVVLLDIGLPRMDGYEVARRLRQEGGHQAVLVALTGYGTDEDQRRSQAAGFDHHLLKPVELDALHELLIRPRKPGR